MSIVEFNYKNVITIIQCLNDEKLEDILNRFTVKIEKKIDNLYFIYGGKIISEELKNVTFNQLATNIDKERGKITLLVYEADQNLNEDENNLIKSKEIICPECGEHNIIKIKNYKITLSGCKNDHVTSDIPFYCFEKTQMIDESKIICNKCKEKNKAISYKREFYICNSCQSNLCPLCKSGHDKSHNIINYDLKNYLCNSHNNEKYISYCKTCKKNLCALCCSSEHENHDIYNFKIPNKNSLIEKNNQFRKKIDEMNENIKKIITELNDFMQYIEKYYDIINNFINNYDINNRNFEVIENINNIINNDIIKDIDIIVNEKSIINKFNKIIEINNKINNKTEEKSDNKDIINNETNINKELDKIPVSYINIKDSKENQPNINQKIKLLKKIEKKKVIFSLCYLEKNSMIAMGSDTTIDFYDLNLSFLNSYNSSIQKIYYIFELSDGNILCCGMSETIYILKIKDKNIELYKKIGTNDTFNFIGIEIINKKIICGGYYLSIIQPSYFFRYSLQKSKYYGMINNIIELDYSSFLISQCENKRIIAFSNETYEKLYQIDNIEISSNNYGMSKISSDLIGICGEENSNACLYILSIEDKIISSKIILKEFELCGCILKLNNNFIMITGQRKGQTKASDLILFQKEINYGKIIIKNIYILNDSYTDNIEAMISINDLFIASDNSAELKVWEIDTK